MSEVKRYMQNLPNGEIIKCVSYEDYAALKAQCDALAAENAAIKSKVAVHAAGFSVCPVCSHEEPSETDDIVWMVNETPTPATDAYLNSVRAEGVDFVAEAVGAKCAELKVGSEDWKALKSIVLLLGDFASKLRAGEPS